MYAQPVVGVPRTTPSGESAKTMVLVGFIIQAVVSAALLFLVFLFFGGFGFFLAIFWLFGGAIALVTILMLVIAWTMSYSRVKRGEYAAAKTPTLLLAVFGILFGALIPGIFYLLGYLKLDDAIREQNAPAYPMMPGAMYAPAGGAYGAPMYVMMPAPVPAAAAPLPAGPGVASAPAGQLAPFCSRCARPTTFVPQYSRYYCYSCGLYA